MSCHYPDWFAEPRQLGFKLLLQNKRHLRQAGPSQHKAYLLGVVAEHLAEILRQDIDGAVERA